MSETNETMGRCRREMTAAYKARGFLPNDSDEVLADALDRLAADVAAVKEAAVPARAMSDVFEQRLAAANRERDEAIRERDKAIRERGEAWDEIRRVKTELAERPWPVGWMVEVERLKGRTAEAIKERDVAIRERDEARSLLELVQVQRAAAYLERDKSRADAFVLKCNKTDAIKQRDEAKADVERLRAELAARPAAAGWLTADDCWQLRVAAEHLKRLGSEACVKTIDALLARAGSPPGWLTDEERQIIANLLLYQWGCFGWQARVDPALRAILARADSQAVVEVPALKFLGSMTGREQGIVLAYRDALDAAGIPWKEKEVPRE